jgi:hypothetical protein
MVVGLVNHIKCQMDGCSAKIFFSELANYKIFVNRVQINLALARVSLIFIKAGINFYQLLPAKTGGKNVITKCPNASDGRLFWQVLLKTYFALSIICG